MKHRKRGLAVLFSFWTVLIQTNNIMETTILSASK